MCRKGVPRGWAGKLNPVKVDKVGSQEPRTGHEPERMESPQVCPGVREGEGRASEQAVGPGRAVLGRNRHAHSLQWARPLHGS